MKNIYLSSLISVILLFGTASNSVETLTTKDKIKELETCPLFQKNPEKIYIKYDKSKPYLDLDRDIKDLGTKFVVEEFFTTKSTLFNFLKVTYESVDLAIEKYRIDNGLDKNAIFLLFKGGNVLRIVANQIFSMLSPKASDFLKENYGEYFKRSDADFSVFIDDKKLNSLNYNEVMNNVMWLTYETLNQIRTQFIKNPRQYFDFFKLDPKKAQDELSKYFESLNDIAAIEDEKNPHWHGTEFERLQLLNDQVGEITKCPYIGQYDYKYEFDRNNKNKIIGIPLNDKTNWIANSINKTLGWEVGDDPDKFVKFDLERMKVELLFTYMKDGKLHAKPIGGELSDFSFPQREDFRLRHFLDNYKEFVANYTLTLSPKQILTVKAESVKGLSQDIYEVVFEQFTRPWEASKYEKRINRMFFLSIINILDSTNGLGIQKAKEYLKVVKESVIDPLTDLYSLKDKERREVQKQVSEDVDSINKKFGPMIIANKIWKRMPELISEELIKNPKDDDEDGFNGLIELFKNNLNNIEKFLTMKPGLIDIDDIYNANMDSLF